jgi:hypothetical protein
MANDYIGVVYPEGIAIYPHLTTPDTKFNAMGEYKVSLSVEASAAAPLIGNIETAMKQAEKLIPKGKRQKLAEPPYFDELDDEGQETGRVVFKFKMKAKVNTKDGRTIEMSPKMFDASGTMMSDVDSIWGGSILRISADLVPFYVAAVGAGVSARLKAVQIIDLKTGGGADASSFGFEATEGYSAPKIETAQDEGFVDEENEDF